MKKEEWLEFYKELSGCFCFYLLTEELKKYSDNEEIASIKTKMLVDGMSKESGQCQKIFLTYNWTKGISKEKMLKELKYKFKKDMLYYCISQEDEGLESEHIHVYLVFKKRKSFYSQSYFNMSFLINDQVKIKKAWIETVLGQRIEPIIKYLYKQDKKPLTNMLIENGRLVMNELERIKHLARTRSEDKVWEYIYNNKF